MAKKKQNKYWDIKPIKSIPSLYKIIYGERSNGKTYGTLKDAIFEYFEKGSQFVYLRRWTDDIKMNKMMNLFAQMTIDGVFTEASGGAWNGVKYRTGAFYPMATDLEGNTVISDEPMAYVFAISAMEHHKSTSYPKVKRIVFDEFISRISYLPDEFTLFMNVLSTIIRDRDDVVIYMLGNTVSKECPYFSEMGLKHVYDQRAGTIDTYSYHKNGKELRIAVEYTENLASKKSDVYFIFDNPKLEMITGGAWELALYPHRFEKYLPTDILFMFFILYRNMTLQCEIVDGKSGRFMFVHRKTTPLKDVDNDLIYCVEPSNKPNWRVDITRPVYAIENKIIELITQERTCFQDNEIGEVFNDYLKWCRQHQVIKR